MYNINFTSINNVQKKSPLRTKKLVMESTYTKMWWVFIKKITMESPKVFFNGLSMRNFYESETKR